jgi:hypothetical protein
MKRAGNLYIRLHTYENLCLAFWKAARGKQLRPDVIGFRSRFDANIRKLQDDLRCHKPDVGHYRFFTVRDPKLRSICAASFPERVLHHAVMNVCEPVLERYAVFDSYACRKGKGNRKALSRTQEFARRFDWYLKLDVRKYFDSIDHAILKDLLARRFKDRHLLELFRILLKSYHTIPGKGMPIGNLISQHLANFYLGGFDHWVKEMLRRKGYLRYMDDFILFGNNNTSLKVNLKSVEAYLSDHLELDIKANIQINRCSRGIPFIGYRVFPSHIRLSPGSRRRFVHKFRTYERNWQRGHWAERELVRHVEPLIEFTRAARAENFRRDVIERFGVPS